MENKYSYSELVNIFNKIDSVLSRKTSQEDGDDVKFERILIFKLRVNQKKVKEGIELAEKDLPSESAEGYKKYMQERSKLFEEFGAKFVEDGRGNTMVENYREISEKDGFEGKMKKLKEDHKEEIKAENERVEDFKKQAREKGSEIEWSKISLSLFPEKMLGNDLPLEFIDFIIDPDESK